MRWVTALVGVAACYHPGGERSCAVSCSDGVCPSGMACSQNGTALCHAAGEADCAPPDGGSGGGDAIDAACTIYGRGPIQVCATPSSDSLTVTVAETWPSAQVPCTQMLAQNGGPDVCVIVAKVINIQGPLTLTGAAPIALIGTDTLAVGSSGEVYAASSVGGSVVGPGASWSACPPLAPGTMEGGGAGGSYASSGGKGGNGFNQATGGATPAPTPATTAMHGGCAGSNGAQSNGPSYGNGGGAVFLITPNMMTLDTNAKIDASGGSASMAQIGAGGSGGGAGGYIGLDAPTYFVGSNVTVWALGGGGSGGGGDSAGGVAMPGSPGADSSGPTIGGKGGAGGSPGGGMGGTAQVNTATAGGDGTAALSTLAGAGGGAGGAGVIVLVGNALPPTASFAPAATLVTPSR